ncbi:MAG: C39 family peptidase [Bacilli bacterium]|jgi:uncharacterized protein YukE|nr:C39 family peptidase [Bacilli bacterium]
MVTSATVKSDSSTIQSMFSSYKSTVNSFKNVESWNGPSQKNFMEQAEKFMSEFISPMEQQLSTFADSLDNLEKYEKLKTQLKTAESNLSSVQGTDNTTAIEQYKADIRRINQEMTPLKTKIKQQINEVASLKIDTNPAEDFNIKDFHLNEFKYFRQGDYHNAYAGETIAAAGCGPTSAAMVLTYLTGETVDPVTASAWSTQHGFATNGNGTYEALFPAIGEAYGLTVQKQSQTASNIVNSLQNGNVIICHMGPGEFTSGGHYIVLREINDQGQVLVADPANPGRNKWYPPSIFEQQRRGSMYSFNTA